MTFALEPDDHPPTTYNPWEVRPGHGHEVSTVVAVNGTPACGVDADFLAAATRAVMEAHR
jgi:hypothetical protein